MDGWLDMGAWVGGLGGWDDFRRFCCLIHPR